MMESGFHIYCIGTAAADKVRGALILKINPREILTDTHGKLGDHSYNSNVSGQSSYGDRFSASVQYDTVTVATWLDLTGHSSLPPDVRYGERVIVWRQSDSNRLYWTSTNMDINKRLLEDVVIMASDTNPNDRSEKTLNFDNCYTITMNTYDKFIEIKTSKNDGEEYLYTFTLSPRDKRAILQDDDGNHFLLDSKNTLIELINKNNTYMQLNKDDIDVNCNGNYTENIGGNFTSSVGGNYNVDVGGNYKLTVGGNYDANISGTNTVKSKSYQMDSPSNVFTGNVMCPSLSVGGGGAFNRSGGYTATITGNIKVNGKMAVTGDIEIGSNLDVGGQISCNGLNSSAPISAPNI